MNNITTMIIIIIYYDIINSIKYVDIILLLGSLRSICYNTSK